MNVFAMMALIGVSTAGAPNAAAILNHVRASSAYATVQELGSTHEWAIVLHNISTGKPEWVSLGVALEPGTDAGTATDLHDAMFHALIKNAEFVLQQSGPVFGVSDLCGGRHDPPETFAAALAEQRAAEEAVARLPADTKDRETCLTALKAGESNLRRFFEGAPK